jgi:hypothetical protein
MFRVTDEDAYNKLLNGLAGEDIYTENETGKDGKIKHFIGAYGSLDWFAPASDNEDVKEFIKDNNVYDENGNEVPVDMIDNYEELYDKDGNEVYDKFGGRNLDDASLDRFFNALQKLLPDGEVFVYTESGHEKLRYVSGSVLVMTNKDSKFMSTDMFVRDTVKQLTGSDDVED